jgi:hypothetical protein
VELKVEVIRDYWAIIGSVVLTIVWLVRLEQAVAWLARQRKEDMDAQREQRGEANKMIAEIRSDIKDVLRRLGQ